MRNLRCRCVRRPAFRRHGGSAIPSVRPSLVTSMRNPLQSFRPQDGTAREVREKGSSIVGVRPFSVQAGRPRPEMYEMSEQGGVRCAGGRCWPARPMKGAAGDGACSAWRWRIFVVRMRARAFQSGIDEVPCARTIVSERAGHPRDSMASRSPDPRSRTWGTGAGAVQVSPGFSVPIAVTARSP